MTTNRGISDDFYENQIDKMLKDMLVKVPSYMAFAWMALDDSFSKPVNKLKTLERLLLLKAFFEVGKVNLAIILKIITAYHKPNYNKHLLNLMNLNINIIKFPDFFILQAPKEDQYVQKKIEHFDFMVDKVILLGAIYCHSSLNTLSEMLEDTDKLYKDILAKIAFIGKLTDKYRVSGFNLMLDSFSDDVDRFALNKQKYASAKISIVEQETLAEKKKIIINFLESLVYIANIHSNILKIVVSPDQKIQQEVKDVQAIEQEPDGLIKSGQRLKNSKIFEGEYAEWIDEDAIYSTLSAYFSTNVTVTNLEDSLKQIESKMQRIERHITNLKIKDREEIQYQIIINKLENGIASLRTESIISERILRISAQQAKFIQQEEVARETRQLQSVVAEQLKIATYNADQQDTQQKIGSLIEQCGVLIKMRNAVKDYIKVQPTPNFSILESNLTVNLKEMGELKFECKEYSLANAVELSQIKLRVTNLYSTAMHLSLGFSEELKYLKEASSEITKRERNQRKKLVKQQKAEEQKKLAEQQAQVEADIRVAALAAAQAAENERQIEIARKVTEAKQVFERVVKEAAAKRLSDLEAKAAEAKRLAELAKVAEEQALAVLVAKAAAQEAAAKHAKAECLAELKSRKAVVFDTLLPRDLPVGGWRGCVSEYSLFAPNRREFRINAEKNRQNYKGQLEPDNKTLWWSNPSAPHFFMMSKLNSDIQQSHKCMRREDQALHQYLINSALIIRR